MLIKILLEKNVTASKLSEIIKIYPQVLVNAKVDSDKKYKYEENKEISNDEILDRLKELIPMIRPNLEKLDKDKYPKYDSGVFPKIKIESNVKYNTLTGNIVDKEK